MLYFIYNSCVHPRPFFRRDVPLAVSTATNGTTSELSERHQDVSSLITASNPETMSSSSAVIWFCRWR
jgi:hypothetical protein